MEASARLLALVALGGALGAVARYAVGGWLTRDAFPWGTVAINVSGSFLLALLFFGDALAGWIPPPTRLLLGVGFLGAFTTMSAFSYETVTMLGEGAYARAALHFLLNPVASVAGALAGFGIAHLLAGGGSG